MRTDLINRLLDELVKKLETIDEKYGYLSFLIEERFTNEKLLQLEVMRIVSLMPEVVEYLPEKLLQNDPPKICRD